MEEEKEEKRRKTKKNKKKRMKEKRNEKWIDVAMIATESTLGKERKKERKKESKKVRKNGKRRKEATAKNSLKRNPLPSFTEFYRVVPSRTDVDLVLQAS